MSRAESGFSGIVDRELWVVPPSPDLVVEVVEEVSPEPEPSVVVDVDVSVVDVFDVGGALVEVLVEPPGEGEPDGAVVLGSVVDDGASCVVVGAVDVVLVELGSAGVVGEDRCSSSRSSGKVVGPPSLGPVLTVVRSTVDDVVRLLVVVVASAAMRSERLLVEVEMDVNVAVVVERSWVVPSTRGSMVVDAVERAEGASAAATSPERTCAAR